MIKYKKFSYLIICSILLLIIFHYITFNLITKHVLVIYDDIYRGDLGRSSFKVDSMFDRPSYLVKDANNLPKKHLNYKDLKPNETVDVITIGDSFSNGATQGINPFYQDYIASMKNKKVVNILPTAGFINLIIKMSNTGVLDELKPKIILVETVERFAVDRFKKKFDFSLVENKDKLKKRIRDATNLYVGREPDISFINDRNFRAFKFNIEFLFNPYDKYKAAIITKMKKDFFTSKDSNSLLYHKEDLEFLPLSTKNNIKKVNDNLNALADFLMKKNIKLYFMPVVDKSNLYSKYMVNEKFPKSTFFEYLRPLNKNYKLIDTKKILRGELKKGIKDVFYSDDAHWSYKASEKVIEEVDFD